LNIYIYIYVKHWWIKCDLSIIHTLPVFSFYSIWTTWFKISGYVIYLALTLVAACKGWTCWSHSCGFVFMGKPPFIYWLDTCDIFLSLIKMFELLKIVLQLSPKYFFLQHFFFFYPSGMYSCLLLWYLNLFCEPAMFDRKNLLIAGT